MTSGAPGTSGEVPASDAFEVVTVTADALRANLCVTGLLGPATAPVLMTALRAHLRTGRRFLRVEMGSARIAAATHTTIVAALAALHAETVQLGGMLVFVDATTEDAIVLAGGGLYLTRTP